MFESAELGHTIDKATYAIEAPKLRAELLDTQYELLEAKRFPVLVLIGGVDGAGKGETVNLLNAWMDPRHIATQAFGPPSESERERPSTYRFVNELPPYGKMGIYFGSWYTEPIVDRVMRRTKRAELDQRLEEIIRFERMLANEGVLLLKFWLHLSKAAQKKRLEELESKARTRWRVTKADWANFRLNDRYKKVSERALRFTSREGAPWIVVEGTDARYRSMTVARQILTSMRARLDEAPESSTPKNLSAPLTPPIDGLNILRRLDLSKRVDAGRYEKDLEVQMGRLNVLSRNPRFKQRSVVCVFEGADAAGKGGAIRRITGALDARVYRVVPIAAPTEEERAQPYLWRFYRKLPRHGMFAIYDRSWYGRVLVERVEGFAKPADWMRAYSEINDFEEQMVQSGSIVTKFWLHIDPEEQLRRFQEREATAFKRFKITPDDWRNREKADAYETAACDMFDRTSTEIAPWTLVEANDKDHARIKVLKTLADRIEEALG